ncbi:MAG: hypothetical protein ACJASV_000580 [Pseudorhodobacter sp.]|jgi:hypothetical protein
MRWKTIRMPLGMGIMMGLMLPWMLHGGAAGESLGLGFVLAHIAIIAGALLVLAFGARRSNWGQKLASLLTMHRPQRAHFAPALAGLAVGWAANCGLCLAFYAEVI